MRVGVGVECEWGMILVESIVDRVSLPTPPREHHWARW